MRLLSTFLLSNRLHILPCFAITLDWINSRRDPLSTASPGSSKLIRMLAECVYTRIHVQGSAIRNFLVFNSVLGE